MKKYREKITLSLVVIIFSFFGYAFVFADETATDVQKELDKVNKQYEQKQEELKDKQADLSVTQKQISNTSNIIAKTEKEISQKETELKALEDRIKLNKNILSVYTQEMYYSDQESEWALTFDSNNFNDYLENFDQIINIKEKVITAIEKIKNDKDDIANVKEELADKKEEHQELLVVKQIEKKEIAVDIIETEVTIEKLQKKMAKLRSTLSSFLGKAYDAKDIADAIKFASGKTGVRKEFLFAMLDKETDLGRFTGGCTYDKSKMGDKNAVIFKRIAKDLGYDYKKLKVSCALSYGIGGAMGVAQFMPTTWVGYEDAISSYTGHKPPDPWNLTDGVMGMAEKLKRGGANSKKGEHNAAKIYYCGGPSSKHWNTNCENYADTVDKWAKDGYDEFL